MNRNELVRRIASVMRERDLRKPVSSPKQVFHISDDEGNKKDFVLKKTDKSVIYTIDDVDAMLGVCLDVIEDALKHGEPITVRGFGTLYLKYRKARATKSVWTDERIDIDARYVPKFAFGSRLRMCGKLFELSLNDDLPVKEFVPPEDNDARFGADPGDE